MCLCASESASSIPWLERKVGGHGSGFGPCHAPNTDLRDQRWPSGTGLRQCKSAVSIHLSYSPDPFTEAIHIKGVDLRPPGIQTSLMEVRVLARVIEEMGV